MQLSLRRWKARHLLLGWAAYWIGLIGVTLSPAIRPAMHATTLPDGHGTISAGFNNGILALTVLEDGVKTFSAATSLSAIFLWVAGPPLLLWVAWLLLRDRPQSRAAYVGSSAEDAALLSPGSGPAPEWRSADRESAGGGRVRTPNP